jgi:hypothetical protein
MPCTFHYSISTEIQKERKPCQLRPPLSTPMGMEYWNNGILEWWNGGMPKSLTDE